MMPLSLAAYTKSFPDEVPGFIHDWPCVAVDASCAVEPGVATDGCDPPQPANMATVAQPVSA
jgi:hypothetical protein